MKRFFTAGICCFLFAFSFSNGFTQEMKPLQKSFLNPPPSYRPVPFWSLNDKLEEKEMARQIKLFKEGGLGGFFIHARIGLLTPYLSEEWFNDVSFMLKEAKKEGLYAWIYDEDRWPSGFASGKVLENHPEFRQKILVVTETHEVPNFTQNQLTLAGRLYDATLLKIFLAVKKSNNALASYKDLTDERKALPVKLQPSQAFLVFYNVSPAFHEEWFNGYNYADLMDEDAVKTFLQLMHEEYKKRFEENFGNVIPGFFTDEPSYTFIPSDPPQSIPWTTVLPDIFMQKKKYDITKHLPALFYDVPDAAKFRYDFWSVMTERFVENYTKQLYQWCDKNKLKLTGHFIIEDTLHGQIQWGANMLHYQYEHMPGIDHLGRNINDVITPKQASSVAHQTGKPRVLSETYGGAGWNTTPLEQKWIADWEFAVGINFINQHLFHYSLRGQRKHDYPPSFFEHEPYWKHYKKISDYFARLSYILSQGKFYANVLVIHPIGSAWCEYTPNGVSKVNELSASFVKLTENLLARHVSFDFGDEMLMEKMAHVKGKTLLVGQMTYNTVILPPSVSLRSNTVKLLQQFSKNGGKIIAVKPLPYLIDGRKPQSIPLKWKTQENVNLSENTWKELTDMRISDEGGNTLTSLYMHHRVIGKTHVYFIANKNTEKNYNAVLHFSKARTKGFAPQLWDAYTGNVSAAPFSSSQQKDENVLPLSFYPSASYVIVLAPAPQKSPVKQEKPLTPSTETMLGSDGWKIAPLDDNALVLDMLSYKTGNDENFSKTVPFYFAQLAAEKKNTETPVALRYVFYSDAAPENLKKLDLVLENPEAYEIFVNDAPVSVKSAGMWKDIAFHRIPIKQFAKQGENTIELRGTFVPPKKQGTLTFKKDGFDITSVCLIGDFHVYEQKVTKKKKRFVLSSPVKIMSFSNVVIRGLPFYAGAVKASTSVHIKKQKNEKFTLSLDDVNAASVSVKVNGKNAGVLLWPPYEINITPYVKNGSNEITLEMTNTLRNLLGPHHHPAKEPLMTGPSDFTSPFLWADDYFFVPFGIGGPVTLKMYGQAH